MAVVRKVKLISNARPYDNDATIFSWLFAQVVAIKAASLYQHGTYVRKGL